jgi:uncharacterized protein YcaQ
MIFRSIVNSVSRYCALQREMAEREAQLMQRVDQQFARETRDVAAARKTSSIWDEWEMRHSR